MDKNNGYQITRAVLFDNGRGFALGHDPAAPGPFVTWQFTEEQGKRDYYWGHYFGSEKAATTDFHTRAADYKQQYRVHETQTEGPEAFKYYSTQRPVGPGTFPKRPDNPPVQIVNYDERRPVEGGAFRAWGELVFDKPLTEREAADYELRPAPEHTHRDLEKRPPIAEQLKEAGRLAQENRGKPGPKKDAPDKGDR